MWYTHGFDLLAKLLAFALTLAGLFLVDPDAWVPKGTPENAAAVVGTIAASAALTWLLVWRPLLLPGSTWAFARWRFQVRPTWREAHALSELFSHTASDGLSWHPSLDVLDVDPALRLDVLLTRARAVRDARSVGWWERSRRRSELGRWLHPQTFVVLNVVTVLSVGPIGVGAFFGRGPLAALAWVAARIGPIWASGVAFLFSTLLVWCAGLAVDRLLGRGPPPVEDEAPEAAAEAPPPRNPFV